MTGSPIPSIQHKNRNPVNLSIDFPSQPIGHFIPSVLPLLQAHIPLQMLTEPWFSFPRKLLVLFSQYFMSRKHATTKTYSFERHVAAPIVEVNHFAFLMCSCPQDDNARLVPTLGSKIPEIRAISMADCSIANIRLFYELLKSERLPTHS